MMARLKTLYRKLGRIEKIFLLFFLLALLLNFVLPNSGVALIFELAAWITGIAAALHLARTGIRKLIWSLRNRLIVAYAFIAMVPIALIVVLVAFSTYGLTGQIALFLVNSELERRNGALRHAADEILQLPPEQRAAMTPRVTDFPRALFPNMEILVEDSGRFRYPPSAKIEFPPVGWKEGSGIIVKDRQLYSWVYAISGDTRVCIMAPLSREFLSDLVPGIGAVDFQNFAESGGQLKSGIGETAPALASRIPPKSNFMDIRVNGAAPAPVMFWNSPENHESRGVLLIHTRISALLGAVFANMKLGDMPYGQVVWTLFLVTVSLFLIVELVSLVVGVSITRTITGAVHELYVGTRRVKEGDFTHRIPVSGDDQLADLSASFNTMTENLQRLIVVAKEKERLESELEIAREVQSQLFPKALPSMKTLNLTGVCNPARVVSGDYYDFMKLADAELAFAIGDVAGKGISAALLMAAIQSTMRMQLTAGFGGNGGPPAHLSTAAMVSRLNKQLYANTSPEKYATFCFALYDENTCTLTYTNAGHLPPILMRQGAPQLLQVTGTVVGAFPFSKYEEKQIRLESGDLLIAYTDGIVEPENEYGEMFGEQRLIDLLVKNADRDLPEVIARVMEAVHQWSGSTAELQDDMTMLAARRP